MKKLNRRGETGIIGAIILFIFFILNWFIWLGSWINTVGAIAITANNLTGLEAFFYANLNFVVLICLILGMLGFAFFGGNQ